MLDSLLQSFSLNTLAQFHFLRPWWSLALLPIVLVFVAQFQRRRLSQRWSSVIAPHILRHLVVEESANRWLNPLNLSCLLMLLFALILMGPTWSRQPSPFLRDTAALVIVLDASNSMQSEDIQPNRLTRAKQKITDLLILRKDSLNALIAFSGTAHTVLPLTNDIDILQIYLDAVSVETMPVRGKFPEKALPLIDKQLIDENTPTTVLLVTDGLGANSRVDFDAYFSERPHQLLVLGVGMEPGESENVTGAPALESTALTELARSSGGQYIPLTIDDTDVRSINRRVDSYYVVADDEQVPWVDQGYYLLFFGLLFFLPWFRRGWSVQWVLLLGLSLSYSNDSVADENQFMDWWLTPDQQGRWAFSRGDYAVAAERFKDPMWKGVSYYYAQEFALAVEYFSRVDKDEARFNLANAMAHSQNYLIAVNVYKQLYAKDGSNSSAEWNRQIVQNIIDAINLMSESQKAEKGEMANELGKDAPRRAEGAEEKTYSKEELVQYSAEEILQDASVNEMWMRSVQKNPAEFLANKFQQQLEAENEP